MKYQVVILEDAEVDLGNVIALLQRESPNTLSKLKSELFLVKQHLADFPFTYQACNFEAIRRAVLYSCRYTLYYRICSRRVEVMAILPQMAGPYMLTQRGVGW